jgi:hypothetical protein
MQLVFSSSVMVLLLVACFGTTWTRLRRHSRWSKSHRPLLSPKEQILE